MALTVPFVSDIIYMNKRSEISDGGNEMNVLERIVDAKRLPILFIGSGISKRYLYRYPKWIELLELSYKKCNADSFQFQKHIESLFRQNLSEFQVNIRLASIIEEEFNAAFFDRKIKLNIGDRKNPQWVKRGISPYKMYLSDYFKRMQLLRDEERLAELEKFKLLKSRVSAVITTNYDSFLEQYVFPEDYTVFVHQEELFGAESYNIAEIYKIHGSASDANSIIITKRDYDRFNETRKLIIAKMLTLFAESPIIFMGYSFTDENIRSIIVDFLSCLSNSQLENISEHFVFISYKEGEQDLIEVKRTIITEARAEIPITEIQTDNYGLVFDILNRITPGISPVRVRETKRVIKTIVDTSISSDKAESLIVGLDDLDGLDLSEKPLAIAIGYRDNILSKIGYGIMDDVEIIEDIIYDNKHFDADAMCFERFKSLAKTRLIPVFKYAKRCREPIPPNSKLSDYMNAHNHTDDIISRNISKTLRNIPQYNDYGKLISEISKQDTVQRKAGLLLASIQNYSAEEIRRICKSIFETFDKESIKNSTHFKRCVMCLDLLENHQ